MQSFFIIKMAQNLKFNDGKIDSKKEKLAKDNVQKKEETGMVKKDWQIGLTKSLANKFGKKVWQHYEKSMAKRTRFFP